MQSKYAIDSIGFGVLSYFYGKMRISDHPIQTIGKDIKNGNTIISI